MQFARHLKVVFEWLRKKVLRLNDGMLVNEKPLPFGDGRMLKIARQYSKFAEETKSLKGKSTIEASFTRH